MKSQIFNEIVAMGQDAQTAIEPITQSDGFSYFLAALIIIGGALWEAWAQGHLE